MRRLLVVAMFAVLASATQAHAIDLQALMHETQINRTEQGQINLVWWVPTEYWQESFRDSSMSPAQRDAVLKLLDKYTIVAILEGTFGTFGAFTPTAEEALRSKVSIAMNGEPLKPLSDQDLSADARNFFQMMRPVLGNMLGQFGQGLQFFLADGYDKKHNRRVDPTKPGMLTVKVGEKEFRYRLPLGSLLPPMFDAETGERYPGNYKFSPLTGKPLVSQSPENAAPSK